MPCCRGREMSQRRPFWYLRRRSVKAEVDEELSVHLEMRDRRARWPGAWRRDDARREALRQFGDLEATREYCRQQDEERENGDATHAAVPGFHAGPSHRYSQPVARTGPHADDHRHGRPRSRRDRGDLQRRQRGAAAAAAVRGAARTWCASTPTRRRSSSASRWRTISRSPNSRRDSSGTPPTPIARSASATATPPNCCARAWCRGGSSRCSASSR